MVKALDLLLIAVLLYLPVAGCVKEKEKDSG
jgi:hypothetical protein